MFCPKCDTQNPDHASRCLSCGYEFPSTPQPHPGQAKTSALAIASLILGLLAVPTCGITVLPAIICGIIALVKISGSQRLLRGTGMAIAGLALSGVYALLLPVLMAILLPAFSQAKTTAQRVVCMTNLRQLSVAMNMYTVDYDGNYPTADKWCDLLVQQAQVAEDLFRCPTAPEGTCTYALNKNLYQPGAQSVPNMVAIFEAKPGWNQVGGSGLLTTEYHDGKGCNVGYVDGSVEFVRTERLAELNWGP
jgi:prepilin-type processing-associated H-X9-DG protein